MDFNVHDHAGVWVGIIENPTSAIWVPRYQKPGDFELYLPASVEMLALLADDFIITRDDKPEAMIVEHIELITNAEEGNYILVSGRSAGSIIGRRIVQEQTVLTGRVDAAVHRLIRENAISPADPARALPLTMRAPDVSTVTARAQYTGTNLLEAVEEICKAHGLGFRCVADATEEGIALRFELLRGLDRSEGQEENSPVIFSAEYENLLSSSYVMDTMNYKNVAIVAGEGEGKARKRATYGSASGMARREIFVDARDLSTNDGEISDDDYTAQLMARGAEKVAEHALSEAFDGVMDTGNTYTLGVDYTLGDIVTVENEYGIRKNVRISAIKEIWDAEGYTVEPIFENVEV